MKESVRCKMYNVTEHTNLSWGPTSLIRRAQTRPPGMLRICMPHAKNAPVNLDPRQQVCLQDIGAGSNLKGPAD